MKKIIALILSALVLIVCLAVARWAEKNNRVEPTDPGTTVTHPGDNTTSPTVAPTGTEPTDIPEKPDDIENGLGWG
jgi:hypothetical protein